MRNKVQVIPLEDLLGQPPLWWRLWRRIGTWVSWAAPQHGGFPEFVVAFGIMLFQAFQVVLVLTYPTRFPSEPAWEQAFMTGFFLVSYISPLSSTAQSRSKAGGLLLCQLCAYISFSPSPASCSTYGSFPKAMFLDEEK
jgi:hypothetical protein